MTICAVVGARPNFMKMAPVVRELASRSISTILLHTGQHYDANMSDVFFDELGMPLPDIHLGVGSDSHARQTAAVMIGVESVCLERRPELIIVAGDVNSTVAAALVASKLHITVAHVEAGLRSGDRTMPEEINRVVTDHVSDLLFVSEPSGVRNLRREGIPCDRIHLVGNCMVDSLLEHVAAAVSRAPWEGLGVSPGNYALLTLHRPSNVDDDATLGGLLRELGLVASRLPVLFPIHPRTRSRLAIAGIAPPAGLRPIDPLPYLAFLGLMARARFVLTDSGGIQEETTTLGVPCLTLRENTERPITIAEGTNRLVGRDAAKIRTSVEEILSGRWPTGRRPETWDGQSARRIVDIITRYSPR